MGNHKVSSAYSKEFLTWLGFDVTDSRDYPGRVFIAVSEVGLTAMEACYEGWLWKAVIKIDNQFEGSATSGNRAEARSLAERKLVESIAQNPEALYSMLLTDVLALINPAVSTGDRKCLSLS